MKHQIPAGFYRSFFDNMVDGLAYCQMVFDKLGYPVDFIYVLVNKKFKKMAGSKEILGKKATEVIPGINISNPELFEICGRVSLSGEPEKFETYIKALSGWFIVSVYCPQREFFVAVFQNITDRKEIERNLENAKIAARNVLDDLKIEKSKVDMARAKEEAILLSIGEGLLATDEKGNIVLINKAAEELLCLESKEVMGKNFIETIPIEDGKGVIVPPQKRPMNMALAEGAITVTSINTGAEYYYVRKNKTKFPVAVMVTPVFLDGKVIGTIEVFRDITKEKEIDKAKTEFVSLASHQLRTPLSAVNWYAEMLLAGDVGKLNKEQTEYLDEVYKGNQRMVVLVNSLLNVSRLELGTFLIDPEPTDIVKLTQSLINEQKPQIDQKKIVLSVELGTNIPIMQADPKIISMVVQNILSNAVKYTPDKGTVNLGLSLLESGESVGGRKADKKSIAIVVSDTGYGIPKRQQDKIFTKLFRADNIRDRDTNGTGLGLYIVKSIVESSGGKIWFESPGESALGGESPENPGTAFYVTLPLAGAKKKEGTKALI